MRQVLDRRRKRSTDTTYITVVKGTKVVLNKEWVRAVGIIFNTGGLGRKGTVTGFSTYPNCVNVLFEGSKRSQSFHIHYLDVQK